MADKYNVRVSEKWYDLLDRYTKAEVDAIIAGYDSTGNGIMDGAEQLDDGVHTATAEAVSDHIDGTTSDPHPEYAQNAIAEIITGLWDFQSDVSISNSADLGIGITPAYSLHISRPSDGSVNPEMVLDLTGTVEQEWRTRVQRFDGTLEFRTDELGLGATIPVRFGPTAQTNLLLVGMSNTSTLDSDRIFSSGELVLAASLYSGIESPPFAVKGLGVWADADLSQVSQYVHGTGGGNHGRFDLFRSRGSAASPSAVLSGDILGYFRAGGWFSTGVGDVSAGFQIEVEAGENWSGTNKGATAKFRSIANTASTLADRIVINSDGTINLKPQTNFDDVVRLANGVTVANLPGTPTVGMVARVTDASSPVIGSTVTGGGAAAALVWYNGSNWTVIGV